MCEWHRFTPIITPLSNRRPSGSRTTAGPASPSAHWSPGQSRLIGGPGMGSTFSSSGRRTSEPDGSAVGALMLGPVHSTNYKPEYYVSQSLPLGPHPSLKGFGRQAAGFKAQFKDAYQTRKCDKLVFHVSPLTEQKEIGCTVVECSSNSSLSQKMTGSSPLSLSTTIT
jgi:hypothetical protein